MDAVDLLKHDHRMVEQLFRDYRATGGPPGGVEQRRGVVEVVVRELSKHAALEELIFYPFAKDVLPDGDQVVATRLAGHRPIKDLLLELDRLSAGDDREAGPIEQLEAHVQQHVEADEETLMPRVREGTDEQALAELGVEMDKAKQTAPTRPHPAAPDEPPALTLAAPVAAIYDRLRDRLQGRPQT